MQRPPRNKVRPAATVFAALGDGTRFTMVSRLSTAGPLSIAALTSGSKVTRQAVAKHLRVLEKAGLVHCARRGRESIWRLDRSRLEEAHEYLRQISRQWDDALGRLRAAVEETAG